MSWGSIKSSLGSILNNLDVTVSNVQRDQHEFSPLLRIHPPSLRKARGEAIDEQLGDISAAWDQILLVEARVLELKEEIKKRRILRISTYSPIFALPDELLSDIFLRLWLNGSGAEQTFGLVCQHWRAVASTLPGISACITLPDARNIETIFLALRASDPHPIHLTVETSEWKSYPQLPARNLGRRLESLAWNTSEDLNDFLWELYPNSEAGSLQNLSVKGWDVYLTDHNETGTAGWPRLYFNQLEFLPKLASLTAERAMTEGYLTSKTLTSLILRSCSILSANLEATIRNTPNLQILSISEIRSTRKVHAFFARPQPSIFVHSALQTLKISDVVGIVGWTPLYFARYPNLQTLSIYRLSATARLDRFSGDYLPPHHGEVGPLERSFYHTVSDETSSEAFYLISTGFGASRCWPLKIFNVSN